MFLAARRRKTDFVPDVPADHRSRDWRRKRNHTLVDIRLVFTNYFVGRLFVQLHVQQIDSCTKDNFTFGIDGRDIDDLRIRQLALDLLDPAFNKPLLIFCRVIFSVLLKVAMRTRFGNCLNHLGAIVGFQFDQFIAQQLRATNRPKVRVRAGDRESRDSIISDLCNRGSAELVTRIGNVALVYRRNDEKPRIPLPL